MFEDYSENDADELHKKFEEKNAEQEKFNEELKMFEANLNGVDKRSLYKKFVTLQNRLKVIEKDIDFWEQIARDNETIIRMEKASQQNIKEIYVMLGLLGGSASGLAAFGVEKATDVAVNFPSNLFQQGAFMAGGIMLGYLYYRARKEAKYKTESEKSIKSAQENRDYALGQTQFLEKEVCVINRKFDILQKYIDAHNTKELIEKEPIFQAKVTKEKGL